MAFIMFMELETWRDDNFYTRISTQHNVSKPSEIKKKKANIFIKIKWFILISIWKFNNRKWKKCRHKTKALNKYKESLMK